ncbi:MAG TPA: TonB-dependent receptor [Steroidobacteraceae bacterium]|nr:TonB-dependent receptor [Steroidobacteraceae bacterium]
MRSQCNLVKGAAGLLAAALSCTAGAQDAEHSEGGLLQEIVVTAQRREQDPQDVGISVSVFGGPQLKALGLESSIEIARLTPGVHVSGATAGQAASFTIRGVTQSDFNDAIEGPVAVYVDDTYIPTLQGQVFGMFDLQRVEVLKGPQGTLFGRNATGGLVHYIVNKPTAAPAAGLDVTYGRFNQKLVDTFVSGPLGGGFTARASFHLARFGNIMKNVYPEGLAPGYPSTLGALASPCCQDTWSENTLSGRLQLQYQADALTVRLAASGSRQNLSTTPYNIQPVVPVVDSAGRLVNAIYAGPNETRVAIGPDGNNYLGLPNSPPVRLPGRDWLGFLPPSGKDLETSQELSRSDYNRVRSTGMTLHVDYDFGGVSLASVTSYTKFAKRLYLDGESGPVSLVDVAQLGDTEGLAQELRLSGAAHRLRWVGGLYYLYIDAKARDALLAPAGSLFAALFGAVDVGLDLPIIAKLRTNSASLFGQMEYELTPRWTAVLGGRVIEEKQSFNYRSVAVLDTDAWTLQTAPVLFDTQPPFTDRRTQHLWAGKAQLEFRPSRDLLWYLGVNRGVKAGSYNSKLFDGLAPLDPSEIPYQPEVLLSYEGGFKKTFGNGATLLNASVYYYDYSNYQAFTFQNVSGYVQNRDANMYGAELQLAARPARGLQVQLGASILDAQVKSLQIAPGVFRDVKPTYAPEKQLFGMISQELPGEVLGGRVTLTVDASYTSDFYHNVRNFDSTRFDGYTLLGVRASWSGRNIPLELSAFCENLTDRRYGFIGFEGSTVYGGNDVAYGKPRWWGVRAAYNFGGH